MKIARAAERLLPLLLFFTTIAAAYYWWRTELRYQSALERIDSLQRERRGQPVPAPREDPPVEPAKTETKIVRVPTEVESPNALKTIDELRARTGELTAELAQAREELSAASAKAVAAAGEAKTLAAQLADTRAEIEQANRLLAAAAAEAKARNERLARAESNEKALSEKLKAVKPVPAPAKVDRDIERRREALLVSILRRYREVTDMYRSFTLSAQNRDRSAAVLEAGDLSRIQSSIQQAEDDLRQLQALK
jgi:septal ring factor EnvC (AmiA/AmiB activator)